MKRRKYNMDKQTANAILQNVFAAGEQLPNTTPFDKLVLRGMAQTTLVTSCMWTAIVMLVLVLVCPFAFRANDLNVSNAASVKSVQIVAHQLYSDEFVMVLEGSTIDYQSIYSRKADGNIVFPTHIRFVNGLNGATNIEVTFPYDGDALNIYIPDSNGEVLQAVLSQRESVN